MRLKVCGYGLDSGVVVVGMLYVDVWLHDVCSNTEFQAYDAPAEMSGETQFHFAFCVTFSARFVSSFAN